MSDHESVQNENCLLNASPDKMNGYCVCFYLLALLWWATSQACWLLVPAPQTMATTQKMRVQCRCTTDFDFSISIWMLRWHFLQKWVLWFMLHWTTFEKNLEIPTGTTKTDFQDLRRSMLGKQQLKHRLPDKPKEQESKGFRVLFCLGFFFEQVYHFLSFLHFGLISCCVTHF